MRSVDHPIAEINRLGSARIVGYESYDQHDQHELNSVCSTQSTDESLFHLIWYRGSVTSFTQSLLARGNMYVIGSDKRSMIAQSTV